MFLFKYGRSFIINKLLFGGSKKIFFLIFCNHAASYNDFIILMHRIMEHKNITLEPLYLFDRP